MLEKAPVRALVQEIVEWARKRVRKDAELIALIQPLVGRVYSASTVSAWAKGHSSMPGEVLLALAKVTGVSVDEVLFGESLSARQDELDLRLRRLEHDEPQGVQGG